MGTVSNQDLNEQIATILIERMSSQADLLLSISMAICGGIVALYLQLLFKKENSSVVIEGTGFIIGSFFFQGISIVFAYLLNGTITALTPSIYRYTTPLIENWTLIDFPGAASLRVMGLLQFTFFIIGLFLLAVVLIKNRAFLSGEKPMDPNPTPTMHTLSEPYKKLVQKRIATNFRGYENQKPFADGFDEFCANYSCGSKVLSEREVLLFDRLNEALLESSNAEFSEFYEKHVKDDDDFANIGKDALLQEIIAVSRSLYANAPDQWVNSFEFSYIWPICKRGPGDLRKVMTE